VTSSAVGLGFVEVVCSKTGRSEDVEYAVDAVTVALLDANKTFVGVLQQREDGLDIPERRVRIEDFYDSVILDTGKQPDDVIVGGCVHAVTLARAPRG
jgi:hypothetical protein